MNFPGHRYLGPGNPIVNGTPVDSDDYIAQTHDYAYDAASESDHIRAADRKAIGDFTVDAVRNSNWHSVVGALGLTSKYILESFTGVQYPRQSTLAERKRKLLESTNMSGSKTNITDTMMSDSPPSKKTKLDAEEKDGEKTGSGTARTMSMYHAGMHEYKKGKIIFKHSRIMSSYGLDFAVIKGDYTTPGGKTQLLTITPFARVPVEILPWYMTSSEFYQLPYGSEVKICRTVITPLGFRTPFPTNTSGITYTNSDLMVMGMFAHGLNNKFYGINGIPVLDTTNPMKATSVKEMFPAYRELLWGDVFPDEADTTSITKIPACFGQIVHLPQYYCQNTDKVTNGPKLPLLTDHINMFMFDQMRGNPIVWEYRPQVCILSAGRPYVPYRNGKTADLMYGNKLFASTTLHLDKSDLSDNYSFCIEEINKQLFLGRPPYDSYIEHSGSTSHGINEFGGGLMPPSMHVGCIPIRTTDGSAPEDIAQPLVLNWKFDTYIEIEYGWDFNYPYGDIIPHEMMTYTNGEAIGTSANIGHAWGYKLRSSGDTGDKHITMCTDN